MYPSYRGHSVHNITLAFSSFPHDFYFTTLLDVLRPLSLLSSFTPDRLGAFICNIPIVMFSLVSISSVTVMVPALLAQWRH